MCTPLNVCARLYKTGLPPLLFTTSIFPFIFLPTYQSMLRCCFPWRFTWIGFLRSTRWWCFSVVWLFFILILPSTPSINLMRALISFYPFFSSEFEAWCHRSTYFTEGWWYCSCCSEGLFRKIIWSTIGDCCADRVKTRVLSYQCHFRCKIIDLGV